MSNLKYEIIEVSMPFAAEDTCHGSIEIAVKDISLDRDVIVQVGLDIQVSELRKLWKAAEAVAVAAENFDRNIDSLEKCG